MNSRVGGRAEIMIMGVDVNEDWLYMHSGVKRSEEKEAVEMLRVGKAPDTDNITAERLNYRDG